MGIVVATTLGLIIWIVLWSLGAKGIDGFMIATLVILLAITGRMIAPHLPGNSNT